MQSMSRGERNKQSTGTTHLLVKFHDFVVGNAAGVGEVVDALELALSHVERQRKHVYYKGASEREWMGGNVGECECVSKRE